MRRRRSWLRVAAIALVSATLSACSSDLSFRTEQQCVTADFRIFGEYGAPIDAVTLRELEADEPIWAMRSRLGQTPHITELRFCAGTNAEQLEIQGEPSDYEFISEGPVDLAPGTYEFRFLSRDSGCWQTRLVTLPAD